MKGNKHLLGAIAGLALMVLLGVVGACVALGGLASFAADAPAAEIEGQREGREYGATHTMDDCIREGHRRSALCNSVQWTCLSRAAAFSRTCFDAVTPEDTSLCEGAPASTGLLADPTYATSICNRFGWSHDTDYACGDVVLVLEEWCAIRR